MPQYSVCIYLVLYILLSAFPAGVFVHVLASYFLYFARDAFQAIKYWDVWNFGGALLPFSSMLTWCLQYLL